MFKITKVVINSSNTVISTKEYYLECSVIDLEAVVIPKLYKLVHLDNLHNEVAGVNYKVYYQVSIINSYNIGAIIDKFNNMIDTNVSSINKIVNIHNKLAKMSNRRNSRVIDSNLLKEVKLEDYINSDIEDIRKFENTIIIK